MTVPTARAETRRDLLIVVRSHPRAEARALRARGGVVRALEVSTAGLVVRVDGEPVAVPEDELPILLPELDQLEPVSGMAPPSSKKLRPMQPNGAGFSNVWPAT